MAMPDENGDLTVAGWARYQPSLDLFVIDVKWELSCKSAWGGM
jgi:hypothetical protein